ncbi:kinase D-interacting substrate of 220 kDa B isoform X1 [Lates japonicus]|uniref:Kinase D-interacting substrate of 220 kDa B isoform X1 n=1 Tax=Lates japonicus TaxID=270547 RepID=A0AAD3MNV0_LATJO|nr:kinase D-interacting substrate of 220 kDa B isoform X1 [Lates japonicus]
MHTICSMTTAIQNPPHMWRRRNLAALKAHLDRAHENGHTPLMLAEEQGSLEIVQELIRRGANVNLDDVDCWSALISAAKEGHVDVVKELLENSVYIEHRDMGGWTALMWAAYKGSSGGDHSAAGARSQPQHYRTAVQCVSDHLGRAGRDTPIAKTAAAERAKVNCSDKEPRDQEAVLINAGVSCQSQQPCRERSVQVCVVRTPRRLIVAVKGGYTDVVKELLKRNPNRQHDRQRREHGR